MKSRGLEESEGQVCVVMYVIYRVPHRDSGVPTSVHPMYTTMYMLCTRYEHYYVQIYVCTDTHFSGWTMCVKTLFYVKRPTLLCVHTHVYVSNNTKHILLCGKITLNMCVNPQNRIAVDLV
jgi:hypothetical protein